MDIGQPPTNIKENFTGRHWHSQCFVCAECKVSMAGKGFITDGEDIVCPECAKKRVMGAAATAAAAAAAAAAGGSGGGLLPPGVDSTPPGRPPLDHHDGGGSPESCSGNDNNNSSNSKQKRHRTRFTPAQVSQTKVFNNEVLV